MNQKEIEAYIKKHTELLEYHLNNADEAAKRGQEQFVEKYTLEAAASASILTALMALRKKK